MGISTSSRGDTIISVIDTVSAANTAAATSGWLDVRQYKGDIIFYQISGALTGSMAGKLQSATDDQGADAADIAGATFTNVTAANKQHKCVLRAGTAPYVRYVGTVTTGPILLSVIALAMANSGSV